jgi:hypothetical protein
MRITLIILGVFAVLILAFRIYLPFFIENQINKNINEMEGLSGSVENVSLSLLKGNIYLSGISIYNDDYPDPSAPFVSVASNNISVDWGALFNRRLVARVNLDSMVINYVIHEEPEEVEEIDIVKILQDLMDFRVDINITNSTLNFADVTSDPHVEFSLSDITLEARYLTNQVYADDTLPASVNLAASAMGTGKIDAKIRMDYMKDIPDFDFELEIESIDITDFNDFMLAYGGFEAHQGLLYVYTEAAANDGEIIGYIKPVLDEIEITPTDDDEGLFRRFYESILDIVASVLESPDDEEHISTRVEFEGRIDDPEVDVWQAVWNLLRNAFVEGFSKGLEGVIDFEDLAD